MHSALSRPFSLLLFHILVHTYAHLHTRTHTNTHTLTRTLARARTHTHTVWRLIGYTNEDLARDLGVVGVVFYTVQLS
jgi:hypothetical protein